MSGFDDNPFGEPTIDNPFADPSIQQAARTTNAQIRVDDYNPFDNNAQTQKPVTYDQPSTGPAIMQPTQEPPTYTKSGQQTQNIPKPTLNTEELQV
ncbi:unnamed protein product, partial [Callosobruchus maculatus]